MSHVRAAVTIFVILTLITGGVYPLMVTVIAQTVFPHQANGSLIVRDGKTIGSELIGQAFDNPKYFWGRPSATSPAYDSLSSSGSNLGPTNPELLKAVNERVGAIRRFHPDQTGSVPVDLVTASASGLDPHISPAAAYLQVERVAHARGMKIDDVRALVDSHVEDRTIGILGDPRVNVLRLNLALDAIR